jgi:hypothetical protein
MEISLKQLAVAYAKCGFAQREDDPLTFEQCGVEPTEQLILFHDMDEAGKLETSFILLDVEPWDAKLAERLLIAIAEVLEHNSS